jgi:primosomal replication protein N
MIVKIHLNNQHLAQESTVERQVSLRVTATAGGDSAIEWTIVRAFR